MDRFIETRGVARFATRAVGFPIELTLRSAGQVSNAERLKLARAMQTVLAEITKAGIPQSRMQPQPGGNPMAFLPDQDALVAMATIECGTAEELGQVHGVCNRADTGDYRLTHADLPAIRGEHPADRAQALCRALDAARHAAEALAAEAGVKLGDLLSAVEGQAQRPEGEESRNRIPVQMTARFAIT